MQGLLSSVGSGSVAAAPQETGFFADLKKTFREGKFKTYARYLGILNVVLVVGLTLMLLSMMIPACFYTIPVGVLVGILELPFCCKMLPICQKISTYMVWFEIYWIRGLLYIVLGICFFVVFHFMSGLLNLLFGPLFIIDGLIYFVAFFRGTASFNPCIVRPLVADLGFKYCASAVRTSFICFVCTNFR